MVVRPTAALCIARCLPLDATGYMVTGWYGVGAVRGVLRHWCAGVQLRRWGVPGKYLIRKLASCVQVGRTSATLAPS